MTGIFCALAGAGAQAAYVDDRITAGSTANSIQILLPAGAAAGDTAVYSFVQDDGNTGSLTSDGGAAGTLLAWGGYGTTRAGAWYKTLTGSDISNGYIELTFTSGAANQGVGAVALWRGGSVTPSLVGQTDSGGVESTTVTLSNPSSAGDYYAHAFLDDDHTATVSNWPTSYTEGRKQAQVGTAGSGGTSACAVAVNVDPGAETFVFSSSDEWIGIVIKAK